MRCLPLLLFLVLLGVAVAKAGMSHRPGWISALKIVAPKICIDSNSLGVRAVFAAVRKLGWSILAYDWLTDWLTGMEEGEKGEWGREGDGREGEILQNACIYMSDNSECLYIYIYRERGREREMFN